MQNRARLGLGIALSLCATTAFALPPMAGWENPMDHSRIFVRTATVVPSQTPVKLKVVRGAPYTCNLDFDTVDPKWGRAEFEHGFDCSTAKGSIGTEQTFTTKGAGLLQFKAGNYGEQVTSVTATGGGVEVTWKDAAGKSVIVVQVYQ